MFNIPKHFSEHVCLNWWRPTGLIPLLQRKPMQSLKCKRCSWIIMTLHTFCLFTNHIWQHRGRTRTRVLSTVAFIGHVITHSVNAMKCNISFNNNWILDSIVDVILRATNHPEKWMCYKYYKIYFFCLMSNICHSFLFFLSTVSWNVICVSNLEWINK